ncbi:LysR family transcriptional regulator [Oxalobacteraceae bacterium]|nr:LysR family transcriptional regulator [Oxalobacteraceae bacterium]
MRKLDSHALELFVAVAHCLNFRQAAEQLHMTQPPLSRAIKQLEQRLGVRLFERDTQGVALTPAARSLLPRAQQILALLDGAEQALQQHVLQPRLRLGLTRSVDSGPLRQFSAALAAEFKVDALETSIDTSPRLVAGLRAGRLDAAVIALPTKVYDLPVLPLASQPMLVALASGHPLARRRGLALADLNGQSVYWIERARQPGFFDHCHAVFQRHGFAPAFLLEPFDHHVLLGDVAAGLGIALLPASFAAMRRTGVSYRKLAEGEELAVGLGLVLGAGLSGAAAATVRKVAGAMLG